MLELHVLLVVTDADYLSSTHKIKLCAVKEVLEIPLMTLNNKVCLSKPDANRTSQLSCLRKRELVIGRQTPFLKAALNNDRRCGRSLLQFTASVNENFVSELHQEQLHTGRYKQELEKEYTEEMQVIKNDENKNRENGNKSYSCLNELQYMELETLSIFVTRHDHHKWITLTCESCIPTVNSEQENNLPAKTAEQKADHSINVITYKPEDSSSSNSSSSSHTKEFNVEQKLINDIPFSLRVGDIIVIKEANVKLQLVPFYLLAEKANSMYNKYANTLSSNYNTYDALKSKELFKEQIDGLQIKCHASKCTKFYCANKLCTEYNIPVLSISKNNSYKKNNNNCCYTTERRGNSDHNNLRHTQFCSWHNMSRAERLKIIPLLEYSLYECNAKKRDCVLYNNASKSFYLNDEINPESFSEESVKKDISPNRKQYCVNTENVCSDSNDAAITDFEDNDTSDTLHIDAATPTPHPLCNVNSLDASVNNEHYEYFRENNINNNSNNNNDSNDDNDTFLEHKLTFADTSLLKCNTSHASILSVADIESANEIALCTELTCTHKNKSAEKLPLTDELINSAIRESKSNSKGCNECMDKELVYEESNLGSANKHANRNCIESEETDVQLPVYEHYDNNKLNPYSTDDIDTVESTSSSANWQYSCNDTYDEKLDDAVTSLEKQVAHIAHTYITEQSSKFILGEGVVNSSPVTGMLCSNSDENLHQNTTANNLIDTSVELELNNGDVSDVKRQMLTANKENLLLEAINLKNEHPILSIENRNAVKRHRCGNNDMCVVTPIKQKRDNAFYMNDMKLIEPIELSDTKSNEVGEHVSVSLLKQRILRNSSREMLYSRTNIATTNNIYYTGNTSAESQEVFFKHY